VNLLLSLYDDDPVLMAQDTPAVRGREAIRALYEPVLKEYRFESEGRLMEVEVSGDLGYFWSAYTLAATPRSGGEPVRSSGKSLFIVRRDPAGRWRIARLMDNSDGPPQ
jgi:ketosteroid isomerase-like protein